MTRPAKIIWLGFLIANVGIIFYHWSQGSHDLLSVGFPSAFIAFGRVAGFAAAFSILLQFFFMGRTPWLERIYGLDKLSRIHQFNGKLAFYFILLHPILLILGYSGLSEISPWQQLLTFFHDFEHVNYAIIGAGLFFVVISSSIYISRSRLRYEAWYFVHLLVYIAAGATFLHQPEVGEDLISPSFFRTYWLSLYAFVFLNHVVFRFARPVYLFFRHGFIVERLERESADAVSLYISGKNLERFSIKPGQFMILRFLSKQLWWQAHPFSLSMMPNGKELRITVRELGDFTRQLKDVIPGTKIMIDGPYGVFTDFFGSSSKILCIAGGIGITPIRSLMEHMLAKGKHVVLLYANRTQQTTVFTKELADLAAKYPTQIIHILGDQPNYQGETGRIDEEKIKRLVPDVASREIYLCGPPPMMESIIALLHTLGIKKSRIHYEKFSF